MIFKAGGRKFFLAVLIWFTSSLIFILSSKLSGAEYVSLMGLVALFYSGSNVYQKKVLGE